MRRASSLRNDDLRIPNRSGMRKQSIAPDNEGGWCEGEGGQIEGLCHIFSDQMEMVGIHSDGEGSCVNTAYLLVHRAVTALVLSFLLKEHTRRRSEARKK